MFDIKLKTTLYICKVVFNFKIYIFLYNLFYKYLLIKIYE